MSVNLIANLLYAHPGDHGPTLFEPQNNGITQSLETIHLELVENKNNLKPAHKRKKLKKLLNIDIHLP